MMWEWAMTHPWMTFFLIAMALLVLDGAITNMFRFFNNILRVISAKSGKEPPELEDEGGEQDG